MGIQFGRWSFEGKSVDVSYRQKVRSMISSRVSDGSRSHEHDGMRIEYHAFCTTKESHNEVQPYESSSRIVVTWDGRLDNRLQLIQDLGDRLSASPADVEIVALAYERWGKNCFARLIGDWALVIWEPDSRSLTLVKDFIGTRQLYYEIDKEQITWSTIIDPLVLCDHRPFALNEEYIAGWFSLFPASHLTPFMGIHAVPPAAYVLLRLGKLVVEKYWDFNPAKRIRYRRDEEYEEHFRTVFAESVRRRLRSDTPVLAELSGGMDSSSIVCVADSLLARGDAETSRLDTISYFDDSEPYWDERPYFTKVEAQRGRPGYHIDVSPQRTDRLVHVDDDFVAVPGARIARSEAQRELLAKINQHSYRVLLSGIGGDEVLGGIPNPVPELADLLTGARFQAFVRQMNAWALSKRRPLLFMLSAVIKTFLPSAIAGTPEWRSPPSWLNPAFIERNRDALGGYARRTKLLSSRPSFQDNLYTLEALRRQLAASVTPSAYKQERRYPCLDRDLLEFLFAIPVEQLIRPGQRRSLLRRALQGIVPDEILGRRRKAVVSRGPTETISQQWSEIMAMTQQMISASVGIVDAQAFVQALQSMREGQESSPVALMRAIGIEMWLRNLVRWKVIQDKTEIVRELSRIRISTA